MKKYAILIMSLMITLILASCAKQPASTAAANSPDGTAVSAETASSPEAVAEPETPADIEKDSNSEAETEPDPVSETGTDDETGSETGTNEETGPRPAGETENERSVRVVEDTENTHSVPDSVENSASNVFINENNGYCTQNLVSINPGYVYWQDGELHAKCFVTNGFDRPVSNINVRSLALSGKNGTVIACSPFGALQGAVIQPGSCIIWEFIFSAEDVFAYGADLSWLSCRAITSYD